MSKITGYTTCITSCYGEEPKDALEALARAVIESNVSFGAVPQGGVSVMAYSLPDDRICWVATQAMVQWEGSAVKEYLENPR